MSHTRHRIALTAFVLAAAAVLAAGCSRPSTPTPSPSADESATVGTAASKAVDYASLLSVDDARAISGYSDATTTDSESRLGTSKYLVIYDSPNAREFLWMRVGVSAMFDEQRRVTAGAEKNVEVEGVEAFTWSGEDIDSGVALRKDGVTYLITSKWSTKSGAFAPLLTQEQLMQAAEVVAQRIR